MNHPVSSSQTPSVFDNNVTPNAGIVLTQGKFTWQNIFAYARQYKKELLSANIIAVLAVMVSIPIPLLMPLLVDEVLLDQPGPLVAFTDQCH
jgi:ABC-type bacteriocin/lantibiotic exporter with double-glycine peptidase domain